MAHYDIETIVDRDAIVSPATDDTATITIDPVTHWSWNGSAWEAITYDPQAYAQNHLDVADAAARDTLAPIKGDTVTLLDTGVHYVFDDEFWVEDETDPEAAGSVTALVEADVLPQPLADFPYRLSSEEGVVKTQAQHNIAEARSYVPNLGKH